jgi:UDP-N-acetylglucosamine 2-epimerase
MKIISIVGARPQFVKLAPFSREVRKHHREVIVHTGQHYDVNMSDSFFTDLEIPTPDYHLEIGSDNHGAQTGKMLIKLEIVFTEEKPDLVVVFGDTNSTLAGALAAAKLNIPVVHIEAGLRSFNRTMPEEINRIVADHVSDYLFTPTETAVENLQNEGLSDKTYLTGDIMVDSLKMALNKGKDRVALLEKHNLRSGEYYLLTLHRPQNVDNYDYLHNLLTRLNDLKTPVVFPVHPRTMKVLTTNESKPPAELFPGITFVAPVNYIDFIFLQKNSKKILTDSGGIQKEAYILKVPCLTIRDETEWVETVEAGWNVLINPYDEAFPEKISNHNAPSDYPLLYGSEVAEKMVALINEFDPKNQQTSH